MALRLRDFIVDMESSTEIPVTESEAGIPDDIYQAALAASQHESDGEDPYGPQPKRFMQTEHQQRQQKRELEIRKLAWTLRKLKETHKANKQRLKKQRQRHSPFEKLPSDLVLKLMQHTHLRNIPELINSSEINQSIFKANEIAVFRGIEIEQFPDWKWLFGDSKHRTPAQSQHLKNAIISEVESKHPGAHGWANDEQLFEILRMINNNEFTGVRNVTFLQYMQDCVDMDIKATELYTKMKIARRTAMCLRSLTFQRPGIVNEEDQNEYGLVRALILPWEARSHLVNQQPASIRAEIRSVLKIVVGALYLKFQEVVRQWTWRYYVSPGNHHQKPQEVKKWMSKLVTGLILEAVIPQWHAETKNPSPVLCFDWTSSSFYMTDDLGDLLDEYDQGNVDVIQKVRNGVEFGQSIGLNLEGLLDGTLAGDYLDLFG